jgi:hypothetical protein
VYQVTTTAQVRPPGMVLASRRKALIAAAATTIGWM